MINAEKLKIGDTFLGWSPQWVEGVVHEMAVVDIYGCCIKLKEDSDTHYWWVKKDITIHEVINRKVKEDELWEKGAKMNVIDIEDLKVGDRILMTYPWTKYVWEEIVEDIKDRVINLKQVNHSYSEWKQKKDIIVLEKLDNKEKEVDNEICPFTREKCSLMCKLFKGACIFDRIFNTLVNIDDNTEDDDE